MNATVEALLVLQERDRRVAELTAEAEGLPRHLAAIDAELAAQEAGFELLRQRTRQVEADRKKIDLEVQAKQAAIARYKAQQTQTRKNEEFAALHHEIEHAEKEISTLEDSELELMEAYDRGLAQVAEAEREIEKHRLKAREKKAALEKRGEAARAELAEARAKQAEAEAGVAEEAKARYRRILKSKKDVALVPVRGGACGGCHMKLTAQTVISAQGSEGLTACDNCGRLVYWAE